FLYESLWSFLAFLLLHYLTKHYAKKMLPGEMTALYLILYAIGRSLLELVRLDSRTVSLGGIDTGLAVATFVSIIVAVMAALAVIIRRARRPEPVFQE
ncbi:MAG: prolipoprotein diacylglyceryl transferase family protein, partial [Candidatus Promineifilaceae bacterium]